MTKPNKPNKKRDLKLSDGGKLLEKREPAETCNAIEGEGYCTAQAGFGTEHPGTGRCSKHGGRSTGRPKKAFSPAEYLDSEDQWLNTKLIKVFEEASNFDPSTMDKLDNEINLIRATLYEYAKKCREDKVLADPGEIKKSTDALAKLLELKYKYENKVNNKHIPTQMVVCFANAVSKILIEEITDFELRKKIANRMKEIDLADLVIDENT